MSATYTPMIEQYREIKRQHTGELLFFRLGDFYEMFFEDAQIAAKELEITLTSREAGLDVRVPMCGVPFHAADNYISKLIQKGFKVAICEQMEDPKAAKGIVKREVIKVVTPGTVTGEQMLADSANNYLSLLYEEGDVLYFVVTDITTGECVWSETQGADRMNALCDRLYQIMPAELVLVGKIQQLSECMEFIRTRIPKCLVTTFAVDRFEEARKQIQVHFEPQSLPENPHAQTAVGCVLEYLHQTVKADLSHINRLIKYESTAHLVLDASALRNLELTRNMRDGSKRGTLFGVLDFTKTAMGGRLLKHWLENPLIESARIETRQDAVDELKKAPTLRVRLQESLTGVYDFERILTRVEIGSANARDLTALKASLNALPEIKATLQSTHSRMLAAIQSGMATHTDTAALIENAIVDDPPFSVREGGLIKAGYDMELDELQNISRDSKEWLERFETEERSRTGIKSLKVGYNRVFGYYIEVTHANTIAVPDTYIRKQTLVNAERYITPELKEFETKILGAKEKIVNLEYLLFTRVRDYVKERIRAIQETARLVAELDIFVSLAEAADRYNYVRPALNRDRVIDIRDGRHPVVERLLEREMFVPNDTYLDNRQDELLILTGPNMAGKSTYMRQAALLVLMTQVGSFIPARSASICPVDRIFTRVGASDDLATGQSTFMVEMNEVAAILDHATANSLVILDEIGRGTSTFDGMSIARAVVEYIQKRIHAKTLFATHYHELTQLADQMDGVKNYSVAIKERGNEVVFLRRIVPGGADKSYGVHVAQLAGLPKKVIDRAQELLDEIESHPEQIAAALEANTAKQTPPPALSLFESTIIEELLGIDVNTITPLEALNLLYRLQLTAKEEAGRG